MEPDPDTLPDTEPRPAYTRETTFIVPPTNGRAKGAQFTLQQPDGTVHIKVGQVSVVVSAAGLLAAMEDLERERSR